MGGGGAMHDTFYLSYFGVLDPGNIDIDATNNFVSILFPAIWDIENSMHG